MRYAIVISDRTGREVERTEFASLDRAARVARSALALLSAGGDGYAVTILDHALLGAPVDPCRWTAIRADLLAPSMGGR